MCFTLSLVDSSRHFTEQSAAIKQAGRGKVLTSRGTSSRNELEHNENVMQNKVETQI